MQTAHPPRLKHPVTIFLLLFLLLIPCYSNTFYSSWQLDDKPNILNNRRLHIDNLMPQTLWKTLHARPDGDPSLYRPVANLSFAMNWFLGQASPVGYHAINFAIHLAAAFILYAVLCLLLSTPAMARSRGGDDSHFIAVLGAALWAINPIQTQAVTYIVQRMAILAALFTILGIYCYVKGRLSVERRTRALYFSGCLAGYLLALGSKENAVMLPVSLMLVEVVFFRQSAIAGAKRAKALWALAGFCLFGVFAVLAVTTFNGFDFLLQGYANRPFSMPERIMTEARIVVRYLGLIFYPSPHRLSVAHDVQLSTSLASPWTTMPSIAALFCLAVLALWRVNRNRLLSFAILFFLINHVVESSVLPLELFFEHRNYLPSLFLFLPVAAGIQTLVHGGASPSQTTRHLVMVLIPMLLVVLGWSTYQRNTVWRTETALWEDALAKAPDNARPLTSLADVLASRENPSARDLDRALALYFKSLKTDQARTDILPGIIGNMASIYVKKQDLQTAIQLYRKALERDSAYTPARYNLGVLLHVTGDPDAAEREIDTILKKGFVDADYYNLKGNIHLWRDQPQEALIQFRKALALADDKSQPFVGIGSALNALGHHRQAAWFLRLAHNARPDAIVTQFLLIQNALDADNPVEADRRTRQLLNDHGLPAVQAWLRQLPTYYQMPPVAAERIAPTIYEKAAEMSEALWSNR